MRRYTFIFHFVCTLLLLGGALLAGCEDDEPAGQPQDGDQDTSRPPSDVDGAPLDECESAADCVGLLGDTIGECEVAVCDRTGEFSRCITEPEADGTACGQDNPCLVDGTCQGGECVGAPSGECPCTGDQDCAQFDDADLCNAPLRCIDGSCTPDEDAAVVCPTDEDTACRKNRCDPATGVCGLVPLPNGTPCESTEGDCETHVCQDGECVCGCTPSCEDRQCGDDGCGGSCGECAAGESCIFGECVALEPKTCESPGLLVCGETTVGDTTEAANLLADYACADLPSTGGEDVYLFSPEAPATVSVLLSGMTADLDLFLLEGSCSASACTTRSTDVAEELVVFDAVPGTSYFVVVDGFEEAGDVYSLMVDCGEECVPDCSGLSCGPDPVCGTSCGTCEAGFVCVNGECRPGTDPCLGVSREGCCDGAVVNFCADGELVTIDCSTNEPPANTCGWREEAGVFDCGGQDEPPAGVDPTCPF